MTGKDSYGRQRLAKAQTKWIEQDTKLRWVAYEAFQKEWTAYLEQVGLWYEPICAADVFKAFQRFVLHPAPDGWEVSGIRWSLFNMSDRDDKLTASLYWTLSQEAPPPPWRSENYSRGISVKAGLVFQPVSDALRGVEEDRWEPRENIPWLWQPAPSASELEALNEIFWSDLVSEAPELLECLARKEWYWDREWWR